MDDGLLLGVDVGTTNCKAILFDISGRQVASVHVPTPTIRPHPNWAEYDPETLWETVAMAIRQVVGRVNPARVRGVAAASMGESGVLLDERGRPLHPIVAWYDSRTVPQYRRWMDQVDTNASFAIAGIRPEPIFGVYKLMWLRDHAPEAYAAAVRWLHVADYIAFRLCGAQATDYSLATRTMLLDLRRRRWSDMLIARAGVRRDLLPELVSSGTRLGVVTDAAAAMTGLLAGTPVGSGGQDHVCGAFAAGVSEAGMCLDSMGTAEAVFLSLDAPVLDDERCRAGCTFGAHVARDKYYTMDGLWTSGAAVEWARSLLAWPESAVPHAGEDDLRSYARMEALAAQAPAGSLGVFFLPRLAGGDRGTFVGLTTDTGAAALGRAVYEGLAYEWRRYLETIESALDTQARTIRLIGGGIRSALWVQIKADILGRPLHVLKVEESVALGAALLAGIAAGVYHDEADAVAHLDHEERIVTPNTAHMAFYERCYREVYLRIAPALAGLHAAISDLPLAGDAPISESGVSQLNAKR
ncbi:MAG TPA: FGGY family carbohydrate kinase [Roseiflexaceae bacterium]|jgi:xylulokinase